MTAPTLPICERLDAWAKISFSQDRARDLRKAKGTIEALYEALGQTTRALELVNETMAEHGLGQSQSAVNVALMGRAALTLAREGAPHDATEGE
jgi:hypothetical protein